MTEGLPAIDVSVLIVAYNSADMIGDCIASIPAAAARHSYEVLLIDNGDGATEAAVRQQFPDVRIVASKGNVGFAAGNNMLAREAVSDKLLLLNPDMVLEPASIDALLDGTQAHPEAAAWGGVTTDADGLPDSGNAIAMPSLSEFFSLALGRSKIGSQPPVGIKSDARVDVLCGGYVMFDRQAWEQVGGLDERYFLYCEEVDLFFRLAKRNHVFWRIAAARGHHKAGHGNGPSPRRYLYKHAGTMQFVRLHWGWPRTVLAGFLIWIAALERYLGGRIAGRRRPKLLERSTAYRAVAMNPGLWFHGYDKERGLLTRLGQKTGGDL